MDDKEVLDICKISFFGTDDTVDMDDEYGVGACVVVVESQLIVSFIDIFEAIQ